MRQYELALKSTLRINTFYWLFSTLILIHFFVEIVYLLLLLTGGKIWIEPELELMIYRYIQMMNKSVTIAFPAHRE